jgi:hypothetical protein
LIEHLTKKGELLTRYYKGDLSYSIFRKEVFTNGQLTRSIMKQPMSLVEIMPLKTNWQLLFVEIAIERKLKGKKILQALVFDHTEKNSQADRSRLDREN